MSNVQIYKTGIVTGGIDVNPNVCTWGYSRNPYIPNTAGSTVLSITDFTDFRRYTATTAGSDGGKYGYPCGSALTQGTVYTWSCELRSNVALTFSRGRIGFEGGGMISGANVVIGTNWTKITNTWTQTSSQAFVIYPSGDLANNNWIDIRNLKCEIGSNATPYIAPSNETGYVGIYHGFSEKNYAIPAMREYDGLIESGEFIEI